MSEENGLDSFLGTVNEKNEEAEINLEDEFTKLLKEFVNPEENEKEQNTITQQNQEADEFSSLDSFVSNNQQTEDLNTFITTNQPAENNQLEELNDFISNDYQQTNSSPQEYVNNETKYAENSANQERYQNINSEEKELAQSFKSFYDGMQAISNKKNLKLPDTEFKEEQLYPNYKPSVGKIIAKYLIDCWTIVNKYDPENMKKLSPTANDEEFLTFAEGLNDTYLQLVIISYVEILINIEICEVAYQKKRELQLKNKIKKELYEEYMALQERKNLFIKKLKEKNFPIDVDRLINNYFHAAQKDAKGAFEALTKNPAMFAPIEFDKMHDRFFGLIKVSPIDGIKANKKIGQFIKKLKV